MKTPNPIDVHVGNRVRIRRTLLGMSQGKLGKEIGLTFQQIQKYERGMNRIGSSRLFELSRVLDVPVSYFFDDLPEDVELPSARKGIVHQVREIREDPLDHKQLSKRETLELIRAYYKIANPAVRKRVFDLVKTIGNQESAGDEN